MKQQLTLREWRERRGFTQEHLAELCAQTKTAKEKGIEITQTAISNIEVARVENPQWNTVQVLAEALDVDPRQIRFGQLAVSA